MCLRILRWRVVPEMAVQGGGLMLLLPCRAPAEVIVQLPAPAKSC